MPKQQPLPCIYDNLRINFTLNLVMKNFSQWRININQNGFGAWAVSEKLNGHCAQASSYSAHKEATWNFNYLCLQGGI